jgi:putative copper resistance protein D
VSAAAFTPMLTALVVVRSLHFGASMLVLGASVFVAAFAPVRLARELGKSVWRMVLVASILACVTALAWLAIEAAELGDGWADSLNSETLKAVGFDTEFGRIWLWRVALSILVVAYALWRRERWILMAASGALLLGSLGLVGHAAMQSGPIGAAHRLNHAVHLLCAGGWLGGLAPLILCLRRYSGGELRADVAIALRRFSTIGQFAVALVVLTGVVNTALTLGKWPLDFSSPYQALLAGKIAIVATMIAIALFNRYVLAARSEETSGKSLRALRINAYFEIGLGLGALTLVSAFGVLAPD